MTSDVSEVLAPCPFCGSGARFVKHSAGVRGTMAFDSWDAVACAGCGATVGACDRRFRNKDDARKAWNTRAQPAVLAVPGWRLVPVEPTLEMLDAAGESIYGHPREKATEWAKTEKFESCAQVGVEAYRVMLAAAPAIHEGGEHA